MVCIHGQRYEGVGSAEGGYHCTVSGMAPGSHTGPRTIGNRGQPQPARPATRPTNQPGTTTGQGGPTARHGNGTGRNPAKANGAGGNRARARHGQGGQRPRAQRANQGPGQTRPIRNGKGGNRPGPKPGGNGNPPNHCKPHTAPLRANMAIHTNGRRARTGRIAPARVWRGIPPGC